ncbi:MAG: ATP-binding protein [bacterium]
MKFGIAAKVNLLYFCIIIVFTFLLGFYFIQHEKRTLSFALDERANSLLNNLSINSEYPVLIKDYDAISKLVKGVLAQKDIIFCKIVDKNGTVLVQEGSPRPLSEGRGSKEDKLIREVSSSIVTKEIPKEIDDDLVLGGIKETKEEIGKIYLAVSLLGLNRKLTDIRRTIAITVIVTIILAFFFSSLFLRFILSRPIDKIVIGTRKIAGGNLFYKIEVKTQDEIGYLASSFNKMTEDLQRTTVSRDSLLKEIAEKEKAQDELKKYAEKVEKINRELDDFTYIISHDLKEPLRSINAFSKFIVNDYKDKLDEDGKGYLNRVMANAARMQDLIENLLEVSRIERKKNPIEEIEVKNILSEVELRFEQAIKEKNAEITIDKKLPKIFCDRIRLTEVFANLISNAIKYGDKSPLKIEIGYKEKDNFHEFYVKDNGPGIEERYYDKIFKIFQRLGRREDHEGTGAGLTIAKKIVEMHKGKIWVESKLGEGSIFYFTIATKKGV